jgi:hypothetical protein
MGESRQAIKTIIDRGESCRERKSQRKEEKETDAQECTKVD